MPDATARTIRRKAGLRRARLRRAVPSLSETLGGGMAWAAIMALTAWIEMRGGGWETQASIVAVAGVFAIGAGLAFPLALFVFRLLAAGRAPEARFAAAFLAFGFGTIVVTAAIYALYYRDYFADWHAATLSVEWLFQFAFTSAGAVYQFAVLGLRLYFPLGFAALFALAIWLARKPR